MIALNIYLAAALLPDLEEEPLYFLDLSGFYDGAGGKDCYLLGGDPEKGSPYGLDLSGFTLPDDPTDPDSFGPLPH